MTDEKIVIDHHKAIEFLEKAQRAKGSGYVDPNAADSVRMCDERTDV